MILDHVEMKIFQGESRDPYTKARYSQTAQYNYAV